MQARAVPRMIPNSLRVPKPGIGASAGPPDFERSRKKLIDCHEILECAADSRLQSTIPALGLAEAITSTSPGIAAALGFPGRAKAPECTRGETSNVRIVHQFSRAWSGHGLDERISVFVVYRVSASARTFRRKAAARAGVQSFPDGVTQFESLIRLPHRRRSSMNESTISTADRLGLGLGSVCSNV